MIPVVFFTTPVAKEGIKASVCGKVLRFEETQMPLKDKNKAYAMLNHAGIKLNLIAILRKQSLKETHVLIV